MGIIAAESFECIRWINDALGVVRRCGERKHDGSIPSPLLTGPGSAFQFVFMLLSVSVHTCTVHAFPLRVGFWYFPLRFGTPALAALRGWTPITSSRGRPSL